MPVSKEPAPAERGLIEIQDKTLRDSANQKVPLHRQFVPTERGSHSRSFFLSSTLYLIKRLSFNCTEPHLQW